MTPNDEMPLLKMVLTLFLILTVSQIFSQLSPSEKVLAATVGIVLGIVVLVLLWEYYSPYGREKQKRLGFLRELPAILVRSGKDSVKLGRSPDLLESLYLPDSIRSRHVHIMGSTGSGKTESVVLNFIKQDVSRGIGGIILDAKGDASFLEALNEWVPEARLKVFDLSSETSVPYNPTACGSPLEASQRLFSSLTWSEPYYRSKAFSALSLLFDVHFGRYEKNPRLIDLNSYLASPSSFAAITGSGDYTPKMAQADFSDLGGLRDQLKTLASGHLSRILSPVDSSEIDLNEAKSGAVIYFRLQSLLSRELVSTVGKLIINHLNYLAGSAHRDTDINHTPIFIPTYLDEFASFACPEFADLISKARSAGLALHFSHQSIGDLLEVSPGFLGQITDNSATKIIFRVNDPDSAEFFARTFGTKIYQKVTQRVTNAKELDRAEIIGEGSQREAHQYRASPDLFKTLPTGMGSVLIAHGYNTPHGASSVFKIQFPKLETKEVQT